MQNIIHLLALIRVDSDPAKIDAAAVVRAYAGWTREHGGYVIDTAPAQVMVCLPDPRLALESLHALMHEGRRMGFSIAGGLVQAIRASEHVPSSPNDFTERTLQTVIELSGSAARQRLAITGKLLSLLQLAVPAYAQRFEPVSDGSGRPVTRVRQMLVLDGETLPLYTGIMHIVDARAAHVRPAGPASDVPPLRER